MLGLGRDILRLVSTGVTGGGGGPDPGYTPPLDAYPALAAYSVRKVSSSYSGPCMEIIRTSDSATQEIYFGSDGLVDSTAIAAFCSGTDGKISKWFDQSGNGNHALQPLGSAYIYQFGVVKTLNGKPAIGPFVSSNLLSIPTLTFGGDLSFVSLQGYRNNQMAFGGASGTFFIYSTSGDYENVRFRYPGANHDFTVVNQIEQAATLNVSRRSSSVWNLWNQGNLNSFTPTGTASFDLTFLFGGNGGGYPHSGPHQEIIFWNSDLGAAVLEGFNSSMNQYYQISNFPDYTSGFLADYPDAAAAYSVRKLSNTAIKCMRVRRAVAPFDEKDIGFTAGGDLDEAAIVAFGGSDVLTVSAWYDQSGQSRHAIQINPNSQPQIYNGTAVITENGKPALDFQVDRKELDAGSVLDVSSRDIFQWSVYSLQTGAFWNPIINGPLYSAHNQNTYQPRLYAQRVSAQPLGNASSGLTIDQMYLRHDYADTSNARTYLDGDSTPVIDLVDNNSDWSTGDLSIGTVDTTPDTYMKVSEVLLWQTGAGTVPSNRAGIETNVNNYYEIIVNDEAATSGFLFDYPNAAVAYSVRQLNNNAEFAMQVERSDGRTLNIGFDGNGDLDTQAIIDFSGASVATIRTWYDQTGTQNHAVQRNTINQPVIYDGSAVITDNGNPAPEFTDPGTDSNRTFLLWRENVTTQLFSWSCVTSANPTGASRTIFHREKTGTSNYLRLNTNGYTIVKPGDFDNLNGSTFGTQNLNTIIRSSASTATSYQNGSQTGTISTLDASDISWGNIEANITAIGSFSFNVQEIVLWDSDQDAAGNLSAIETDIMTYYNIP